MRTIRRVIASRLSMLAPCVRCVQPVAVAALGLLLLLAGVAGATGLPTRVVLKAPELFAAGEFPIAIESDDLNGDGLADLVTGNRDTKNVSVLFGDGSGRFAPAPGSKPYPVGSGPSDVAVGNLDRDGAPDVAVTTRGWNTVTVLLNSNEGTGRLDAKPPIQIGTGTSAIVIGKFNGDVDSDLAVANGTDGTVLILLGPDFSAAGPKTPVGSDPESLAVGDFNRDNKLDLVVANRGGSNLSVLLGDGTGGFSRVQSVPVGKTPTAVTVDDLNRDGNPDVVATIRGTPQVPELANSVSVLFGDGTGGFPRVDHYGHTSAHPSGVAVADVDGDGRKDIVAASGDSAQASILWGQGQGLFEQKLKLIAAGRAPLAVTTGNFNGDSSGDLAFADSFLNGVAVVLGDRQRSFREPATSDVGRNPIAAAVGYLDGDLKLDAVIANSGSATVSVLMGDGTKEPAVPVGLGPNDVALHDLDGDGVLDLVVANRAADTVSLLQGNGTGAFAQFDGQQRDLPVGSGPHAVAIDDLNGDGRPDLVVANYVPGTVSVLLNQGGGSFVAAVGSPYAAGQGPVSVAIADVTNDGLADVAVADFGLKNIPSQVAVLRGHGDGRFDPAPAFYGVGQRPTAVAAADVNGDSLPDLAVTNRHESTVSVLLADGSGGLVPAPGSPFGVGVGNKPVAVAIDDLNGDRYPDLVIANSGGQTDVDYCTVRGGDSGGISVLAGDGTGTFTPAGSYASLNDACDVAVGDLNNDNRLDVTVPAVRERVAEFYLNETP